MKKNFAVIGYGGQGGWHTRQILASDVAALTGIYDIDPKKLSLPRKTEYMLTL
ncbi:MAG: hypothetical protein ACLR56_13895 [Oscillospiraceae bacterium]